jgi:hypothetical protein|mmetsp:Transcript_80858/g.135269  ORF Transcript_80858/g.135269 Transcript_80858/m.135269 type:complete len:226 (+) Transcript_80858:50-727(+)
MRSSNQPSACRTTHRQGHAGTLEDRQAPTWSSLRTPQGSTGLSAYGIACTLRSWALWGQGRLQGDICPRTSTSRVGQPPPQHRIRSRATPRCHEWFAHPLTSVMPFSLFPCLCLSSILDFACGYSYIRSHVAAFHLRQCAVVLCCGVGTCCWWQLCGRARQGQTFQSILDTPFIFNGRGRHPGVVCNGRPPTLSLLTIVFDWSCLLRCMLVADTMYGYAGDAGLP